MPSGPKKRRAARRNRNRKGETGDSQYEEDDYFEPTSIKEDDLAKKTPNVESAKAVDDISSKGVVLVQSVGSKDGLDSVSEGKEKEQVLDSSLEEKSDKSVEVADRLAVETTAAADVEEKMSLPGDIVSSRGFLVQDVGFKDVLELGSTENDGKEVAEGVVDLISEADDDGKQPQAEILDSGPLLKVEEDDFIEPTSTKLEDCLTLKSAEPDVELAKELEALSPKGVIQVQNEGSKDGLKSVSEGKEVQEHVLDSNLEENCDKPVDENVIIESTSIEVADRLAVETNTSADDDVDEKMSLPGDIVSTREIILEQDVDFKDVLEKDVDVLELGSTESDGKEVAEDAFDSILEKDDDGKQPQTEVLNSGALLKGPKKRRAGRRNKNKKGETADSQFEEDDLIDPTTKEADDGLAVKAADPDVELAKAVKENHDKPVDENVIVESTSIEVADCLAVETTDEANVDEKMSLPGDVLSSRGILVPDEGIKDVLELALTDNDGKEVAEDILDLTSTKIDGKEVAENVLDSTLEEEEEEEEEDDDDNGKQPQAEVLDLGPVMKGRKKRRAAKKKAYVSSHNETDSQVEENDFNEHTPVKVEDGLDVKTTDAADVESGEPVESLSIKQVILVQDVVPKDVFESGLSENDGKEVSEDVLETRLEKDESKPPAAINDSDQKENEEKPVEEVSHVEPSYTKSEDDLAMTTVDIEWTDAIDTLSEGDAVVEDVGSEDGIEVGLKGNYGKEVIQDVLNVNLEEDEGKESPPTEVNDSDPKENDNNLVEENVLLEANSTKLEDGLAVTTFGVNTEKPIDEPASTNEIALVQDVGSEDAFKLDLKENKGNNVIEDILDSRERVEGKETHVEVNESGANENPETPVDKNAISESSSTEEADRVAIEAIVADDLEVAETSNVLSSMGIVFDQVVDLDALDLGLKKHDWKERSKDVLDSSVEDDEEEKSLDVLQSGPALKGRKKKKRAAKKKTSVSSQNETGSQVEENAFAEPTLTKVEDGLDVNTIAAVVKSGEPVPLSTKEVILVQDSVSEDVFDLGLSVNEDVLDSSLNNDELKEAPVEVNCSGPKENEEKPVEEISLIKPYTKLEDSLAMTTAADVELPEPVDTLTKEIDVVQDVGSEDGFEVGMKDNDGKEVIHEVLDLNMEEAKGKERAFKPNDSGLEENDDDLVKENVFLKVNSIELEDSLAVITADAVLAKPVDDPSSEGASLVQDIGVEKVFHLGFKETDEKVVNEDVLVLNSSLEKVEEKEQSMKANDSNEKENHEKTVEGGALVDPTSIDLEDGLAVTTAADVELANLVDSISTKGVVPDKDLGSENILELGPREHEGTDVNDDVIYWSLEEDNEKEITAENLGLGSILKGPKKRRAAKKKTNVHSHNDSDSQGYSVDENASIKPTPLKAEDGLVGKTAAADVELGEPVDVLSTKEVILVQEEGHEDVFELGLRANDRKELYEDILEPRLEKDEWKEPPVEINDSGPKENKEKLVMEVSLNEASYTKSEDGLTIATAADLEWAEQVNTLSEWVVVAKDVGSEDEFEMGSKGIDRKEVTQKVLELGQEKDEGKEPPCEVSGPKENDDNLDEKNVLFADVKLAEPSSKEIALDQDIGSEDVFQLGFMENDRKEDIKDVLDSSLEKTEEKQPPMDVKDSDPKELHEKAVEEHALIDSNQIEPEDDSAVETTADVELAEPKDAIPLKGVVAVQDVDSEDILEPDSKENEEKEAIQDVLLSREIILPQDIGFEDVHDLGPKENDGKEVIEDALISEQPPMEGLNSDSVLKGPKKRRAAKKKTNVSSQNETDSQGSRRRRAAKRKTNVSSQSETESKGPKENYDNQVEENVLDGNSTESGLKENDGKEDIEVVLDSTLEKLKVAESLIGVNDSVPRETPEKAVEEDTLIDPTPIELGDDSVVRTTANIELAEPLDAISYEGIDSEDILEMDLKKYEGKEVIQDVISSRGIVLPQDISSEDVLELGPKENDGKEVDEDALTSEQPLMEVLDSDVLKGPKKRRAAKKKTIVSSQNETDSQGPKESYGDQVDENALIEANSTKLVFKENDGKEDIEDAFNSCQEKFEVKEPLMEVNDSGPLENYEKEFEEDPLSYPTPIELENDSAVKTTADVELAKPVDVISSKGDVLVRDVGSEDILEQDSKKNEGKEVIQDVISSRGIILPQHIGSEDALELNSKENDGKEVNEDDFNSEQPPTEVLDSGPVLKGPKKRRAAKKKTNDSSQNETDSQGPRKKRTAKMKTNVKSQNETDSQGPKENYNNQVEENDFIEANATVLEEGLAVRNATADVESRNPVDEASSKGVALLQDIGNDEKELTKDIRDSSQEKVEGKEQLVEINDLGPVEKDVLVRDEGSEDNLEFGSKKNEGKGVIEDIDSSSEEDDETHAEGLGPGSIFKVVFSKYCFTILCIVVLLVASKQQFVSLLSTCSTGSSWSRLFSPIGAYLGGENALTEYNPMDIDEAWVLKIADDIDEAWVLKIADDIAELVEPAHSLPSKGFADDVGSDNDLGLDSDKNRGHNLLKDNELAEEHLDSGPMKKSREPAAEDLYSVPKENDGKPVVEDPLTGKLELASDSKETEGNELASIVRGDSSDGAVVESMEDDSASSKEVVQNVLESGSRRIDGIELVEGKELAEELFESGPMVKAKEPTADVLHSDPKENDGKPVLDDPLTDELEMASHTKETEGNEFASIVGSDYSGSTSKEVVQNVLESGDPTENDDKPEVEDFLNRELELESDKDLIEGKEMDSVFGGYPLDSGEGIVKLDHMEDDSVILSREVIQNVFELGSISSDGEDFLERNKQSEKVVDESAVEDLWIKDVEMETESMETGEKRLASKEVVGNAFIEEPVEEVPDSSPKDNDGERVVEDLQADELEMTSESKEIERKDLEYVVASDDSVFPKTVVQNDLIEEKSGKQNLGKDGDDLMTLIKEVRKTIKEQLIVVEDMRVNLRQMLDKVNLIRTAIEG